MRRRRPLTTRGRRIVMLARARYLFREMQTHFPFSEAGIAEAGASAREMRCVQATVVPRPDLVES